MNDNDPHREQAGDAAAPLPSRRFEGREEFRRLLHDALAVAAREGWREIVLADPDFEDWPLGERAFVESLQAWSAGGRRLVLLARNYDAVLRQHARFVHWRRQWSHIVSAVACPGADRLDVPSALWSPAWVLERRDIDRCNGYCGGEADRRVLLRGSIDEWLHKATPAFPATTLGL
jgi:hypothetical protein